MAKRQKLHRGDSGSSEDAGLLARESSGETVVEAPDAPVSEEPSRVRVTNLSTARAVWVPLVPTPQRLGPRSAITVDSGEVSSAVRALVRTGTLALEHL